MITTDQLQLVSNSVFGGNLETIFLQQAIRLNAVASAINFQMKRAALSTVTPIYIPPSVAIAGIPVTTRTQESYMYQSDVPHFPTEKGAVLTDHVILHPIQINIAFVVSNWNPDDAKYSLALLDLMWRSRKRIELQLTHRKLDNMVLTHLQADNEAPNWRALSFRATFEQVNLVELQTVPIEKEKVQPTEKTSGAEVSKSAEYPTDRGYQKPQTTGLQSLWNKMTGSN